MKTLVLATEYGSENAATFAYLCKKYPNLSFSVEREWNKEWSIYVSERPLDAKQLDEIRNIAVAFRDGVKEGYISGWNDRSK